MLLLQNCMLFVPLSMKSSCLLHIDFIDHDIVSNIVDSNMAKIVLMNHCFANISHEIILENFTNLNYL